MLLAFDNWEAQAIGNQQFGCHGQTGDGPAIRGGVIMADQHAFHEPERAGARAVPVAVDIGLRAYMLRVYNYMAGGLALTGAVAYFGATSGFYASVVGTPLFWVVLLAPLALVFFLSFRIQTMSLGAAQLSFWAYAGLVGLSLSGIFLIYTGESIARVFFISAATFGATSLYGYTTRTDLSRFGSFLFMGLIGIVIAGLVNIFLASSALQFAISVIGVLVFTGLTAYDTQRVKEIFVAGEEAAIAGKKAIMGALTLYLDFLNLFLMLMQLFGDRRR
jgi:FtsH-binding integral membrane protein